MPNKTADALAEPLRELVLEDFTPHYGQLSDSFAGSDRWQKLRDAGSELWLDSGDIEAVGRLWTRQFSAVTTNNTLLNHEVQKGQYDSLIKRAASLVRTQAGRKVEPRELVLEIAFVLNARHALRLVEAFDAFVSVEEHTDLANDIPGAIRYARRYAAICPQRFFVKIPLTPAGLIAARCCHEENIPVNLTLGFSARQNYLAARFARPRFVNVFLGRLNQWVIDNKLGDGKHVGEKATLASQRAVRSAASQFKLPTRQIAASIRGGEQLLELAGVDVITLPIGAAEQFNNLKLADAKIANRTAEDYAANLKFADTELARSVGIDKLWDVPEALVKACDELDRMDVNKLSAHDLEELLGTSGVPDLLVNWSADQIELAKREGLKIPTLNSWKAWLTGGQVGLDALMNLAGLGSFAADQHAMDQRIRQVLEM